MMCAAPTVMKFLLVFILTIQTVYSSSDEFNEYLKSLQSQFKSSL